MNFRKILLFFCNLTLILNISCKRSDENIPQVETIDVSDITRFSALVDCKVISDNGYFITRKGVCLSVANNQPTTNDITTNEGSGASNFTSFIGGLSPGTTVYIRAYATNENGTGYGNIIVFKTLPEPGTTSTFIDQRDGTTYNTREYGSMTWFTENLRYLPQVDQPLEIRNSPAYYVYDYLGTSTTEARQSSYFQTYGVLYNWTAALQSCPPGWRIPTRNDWAALIDFFGSRSVAGGRLKSNDPFAWANPNIGATNESGFSALPAGYMATYLFWFDLS